MIPRKLLVVPLVVGAVASAPAAAGAAAPAGPATPVQRVDLQRYAGTWYQLAAIPAVFELQCAGNVQASYTVRADGRVGVQNRCRTWLGGTSSITGVARSENPPANSLLTVSFFSLFGHQIYAAKPNYSVFGLDRDYRWALVGGSDRGSGFVLSRTPALPESDLREIRREITAAGFDVRAFRVTRQDGGAQRRVPLG